MRWRELKWDKQVHTCKLEAERIQSVLLTASSAVLSRATFWRQWDRKRSGITLPATGCKPAPRSPNSYTKNINICLFCFYFCGGTLPLLSKLPLLCVPRELGWVRVGCWTDRTRYQYIQKFTPDSEVAGIKWVVQQDYWDKAVWCGS